MLTAIAHFALAAGATSCLWTAGFIACLEETNTPNRFTNFHRWILMIIGIVCITFIAIL